MFNLDAITNKNNKDNYTEELYRILIVRPSGSGKTNALLNLFLLKRFICMLKT